MRNAMMAIRRLGITPSYDEFHNRKLIGGHPMQESAGEGLRIAGRDEAAMDPVLDEFRDRRDRGREERQALARRLHQLVLPSALILALLVARAELRHGNAGFCRQPLDRLGEGDPFCFDKECEDVTVLARRKAVIEALLVVNEERR